jgi:hypothetical protein
MNLLNSIAQQRRRRSRVSGFTLGWETPVSISTVGDTIVETDGTLIEAKSVAALSSSTVNGVLFTNTTLAGFTDQRLTTLYQNGVIGAAFETMMDSYGFISGTSGSLTLTGLTSGKTYLFQAFVSDDRAFGATRNQYFTIGAYISDTKLQNTSSSYICRFVASATTQVVNLTSNVSVIINGYQVRQLD